MSELANFAKAFTADYYEKFTKNRQALLGLYTPDASLTFEGQEFKGQQAILEKLTSLQFGEMQYHISTTDAQISQPQINAVIIFVTGMFLLGGETNPLSFSQVFQLVPTQAATGATVYLIQNDIFRLNIGG
jgi:hypothetical protein